MAITSRGFSGRRTPSDVTLPPGQYPTTDFPVLSAGRLTSGNSRSTRAQMFCADGIGRHFASCLPKRLRSTFIA